MHYNVMDRADQCDHMHSDNPTSQAEVQTWNCWSMHLLMASSSEHIHFLSWAWIKMRWSLPLRINKYHQTMSCP